MPIAQFLLDVHEHQDRMADPNTKFPPLISSLVLRVAVLAPSMLHHHARLRCCLQFHYHGMIVQQTPQEKIAPKTTRKATGNFTRQVSCNGAGSHSIVVRSQRLKLSCLSTKRSGLVMHVHV
jgi:hypothetical protein